MKHADSQEAEDSGPSKEPLKVEIGRASVTVYGAADTPRETPRGSLIRGQHLPVLIQGSKEEAVSQSAAGLPFWAQLIVYAAAVGILTYVVSAPSLDHHHGIHGDHKHGGSEEHGGHGTGLMKTIAYSFVSAGSLAYLMHLLNQPILLGYLLGGVLIGPIGLRIIVSDAEIHTISELGLFFLLFMIGLELDISELLSLGKQVFCAGSLQFPACTLVHYGIFQLLSLVGLSVGTGQLSVLYVSACCALSSTMIVVKLLQAKQEMETHAGKITIGILIFQDLWAIVFLAVQPNMTSPDLLMLLKTFGMIGVLVAMSFAYSKYILPPVLKSAAAATELMLVLSLTWCFFVCCVALLDWVNLSMELAALIAGMSMAAFPYSTELNAKIKYIRDFFITLYFVALGMQIPVPTFYAVSMALIVCIVVVTCRWVGIFCTLYFLDAGEQPAALTTLNLANVSEFALVIAALGKTMHHVNGDTMTILIWTFSILAVSASYLIEYNERIFEVLFPKLFDRRRRSARCESFVGELVEEGFADADSDSEEELDPRERDIIFLGCFLVAWNLIEEIERRRPELLRRMCVIDFHDKFKEKLEAKGIAFSYGDIASADVLSFHHSAQIVISTVPDAVLRGSTNKGLVIKAKEIWPHCQAIAIANNVEDATEIYKVGADYVLMITKLGAERIADILVKAYDENPKTMADLVKAHDDGFKTLNLGDTLEHLEGSDNPMLRRAEIGMEARPHQASQSMDV